jgi:hypothetical protein
LSAGANSAVCPINESPICSNSARYSAIERFTRKPGIDSNLSNVPPVCPSPRPEIIGTATPHAATIGARCSETLSPTPPVECLSALGNFTLRRSATTPEFIIASV